MLDAQRQGSEDGLEFFELDFLCILLLGLSG